MRYILFFLLSIFFNFSIFSQDDARPPERDRDSSGQLKMNSREQLAKGQRVGPDEKTVTIKDYKIISHARDTTFLDTTLTIQKEYRYNYLRKDDFELMPFANVGQPYTKLGVDFERFDMYPKMGARAKTFNYLEIEGIDYYNVATPMTDLFFKTTFEQGQLLDAMLTFNTSERLNFSLHYKGFRSMGKYQWSEAESGNFRTTTNYVTKNGKYRLRAHIAAQDILSEENGGLSNKEEQFESGDDNFTNRIRVDVRFADAESKILGKRYYLDHIYKLLRSQKDSSMAERTALSIGHKFSYETKYYQYQQTAQNDYFGDGLLSSIDDKANLKTMFNEFNVVFNNLTLGRLEGNISLYNYDYFFNSILITATQRIQNRLNGEEIALGGSYSKQFGKLGIEGRVKYNLVGDLTGSILDASATYKFNEKNKFRLGVHSSTSMPDFNFLLYQSDYTNYNWQNTSAFEKEKVNGLRVNFDSKVWGDLSLDYTTVGNYSYFASAPGIVLEDDQEQATVKPFQEKNILNHTKVQYRKEFRVGSFALNNTLMYQNVSQANNVLNLPQFVTRNTLYFSSDVFKKAMFLQTGITLKYFTAYNIDAYNPVLGEFYIQNKEKLGGFPMLDFFINARIQQTRIYLKAEHFNSSFGKSYNFYAAPNYPYRDFVIRFGLVWNFFS
ncbi:putative porin [Kriegella aquimaris]|uniref:Putative porin n=1 Tax=Kriegella aquimaris TaxID=192904 RepID=A0A1G9UW74_9FLAO|nr:putative porin [Kriegella aquimaris]SDM64099.1 Putative porin [Kriegella aquimaris]